MINAQESYHTAIVTPYLSCVDSSLYGFSVWFSDHRTLVYTEVSRQNYLVPKLGGTFDASEFEAHPERYRSVFADEVFLSLYLLV